MNLLLGRPLPNYFVTNCTCIPTPFFLPGMSIKEMWWSNKFLKSLFMILSSGLKSSKQMWMLSEISIPHALFTATEKEMKPMVLKNNILGSSWVFHLTSKTKPTSMYGITRKNYHDTLRNIQITLDLGKLYQIACYTSKYTYITL